MPVELPPPPYELDALEPHMSKSTMEYHWGKHHRAYVDNLNKQIAGSELDSKAIVDIVRASWANGKPTAAFNNAAQTWNHTFFWEGMCANGGGKPSGKIAQAIDKDFGSYDEFSKQFKTAGATQFGSGWAWLTTDKSGKLSISKTPNAETPIVTDENIPVLTMDVWEHAYYLDYQNKRPMYMEVFLEKLVNWPKVEERYTAAMS